MKAIPCPITPDELKKLYLEEKLTDEEICLRIGTDATVKRVRAWRRRYGIETICRTERHVLPPIEGRLQSVLVGSILGDGGISKSTHVARYSENHSHAQLDYLLWKMATWGAWVPNGHKPVTWNLNGKSYEGWRFGTLSHASLVPWYLLFYPQLGPKRLQESVIEMVDPLAFAIWYMDDGSAAWWPLITFGMDPASRGIALAIFDKFGFSPRWELCSGSTKTGQFVFDGEDQAERFIDLVKPHMPECMHYKLTFGFQGPQYQIRKNLTAEKLQALADEGVPIKRMAELLGEAPTTVDRYLQNFGIVHHRTLGRPIER